VRAAEHARGGDALKLAILTGLVPREVREAVWSEFDLATATWTIRAERMKAGDEHSVPLIALLRRLQRERCALDRPVEGSALLFNCSGKQAISDTILKVLRDVKLTDVTVHWVRRTFTDSGPAPPKAVASRGANRPMRARA
jgi:integrase